MYELTCLDLKRFTTFDKKFSDIKLAHNFYNKCKYSNKLQIIGIVADTQSEIDYIKGRI